MNNINQHKQLHSYFFRHLRAMMRSCAMDYMRYVKEGREESAQIYLKLAKNYRDMSHEELKIKE